MIQGMVLFLWLFASLILSGCSALPKNCFLEPKPPSSFRLVSYNINWGEGVQPINHPQKTIKAIDDTKADIILLQETTPYWEKLIVTQLKPEFPYIEFRHFPNSGGLAILSKQAFKTHFYGETRIGWFPIWIITTKTSNGKLLQIANVHLHPPLVAEGNPGLFAHALYTTNGKRRREIQFVYAHLQPNLPTIIAGDFNEGKLGPAAKWLKKKKFVDASHINPVLHHTWEWSLGLLKFYDRFDKIFYNSFLRLRNFQVVHWGTSDHYPVVADFNYKL